MTPQEAMLWSAVRNNALAGLHFRRQQVIAGFVVDFYCASARLAVEVDGAVHLARTEYDARLDQALSELGVQTLRVTNDSIMDNLEGVLRKIRNEAVRLSKRNLTPSPPSPEGEGGTER
jgi:very-short-patch-repair endonuclease